MNIAFEKGAILALFRQRAGLTKTDVANHLGLSVATVINYEKGYTSPSLESMSKLKKLYGEEFVYAMKMIFDEGKKPYLHFRDSSSTDTKTELTYEQRHYPNLARVKEYLNEIDSRKNTE